MRDTMSSDPLADLYSIKENEEAHRARVLEFLKIKNMTTRGVSPGPFWFLTVMMRANQNDKYDKARIIGFMRDSATFVRRHFNGMSVEEAIPIYFECVEFILHGSPNDIQWWLNRSNGR